MKNSNLKIVTYNFKTYLRNYPDKFYIAASIYDVQLESFLINNTNVPHEINNLVKQYLNFDLEKQLNIDSQEPFLRNLQYARSILILHSLLWKKIREQSLEKMYLHEVDILFILCRMELNGVLIDKELLLNQKKYLKERIEKIRIDCMELAKTDFELSSPKQISEILYKKMNFPILKKTSTGQISTSDEVLKQLSKISDFPQKIMEYRHLHKIKSNYIDKLPLMVDPNTSRINTYYDQSGTLTGRISSYSPNLQNIPVKTKIGLQIRKAFIVQKGFRLLSADYSQIELRVMAHLSDDSNLKQLLLSGLDIHTETASSILGIKTKDVSAEERRRAKIVNFSLMYGMGPYSLSKSLDISYKNAQEYINNYFDRYSSVKNYLKKVFSEAEKLGYVKTIFDKKIILLQKYISKYIEI